MQKGAQLGVAWTVQPPRRRSSNNHGVKIRERRFVVPLHASPTSCGKRTPAKSKLQSHTPLNLKSEAIRATVLAGEARSSCL